MKKKVWNSLLPRDRWATVDQELAEARAFTTMFLTLMHPETPLAEAVEEFKKLRESFVFFPEKNLEGGPSSGMLS